MGSTIAEIKASMESLKSKIRSQMEVMQAELDKERVPGQRVLRRPLSRKLGCAEDDWREVEGYYTHILTLISEQEAVDGRLAHE